MATENNDKLAYSDLALPVYRNTGQAFANLDVTDLVKAAVLAPINILLVGNTGTGKSQLATDIYRAYFGGNKADGGSGVFIRAHPEVDVHGEILTRFSLEKGGRELTDNLEALVCVVDELNRAPPVAQNQFFGLGDGVLDFKGRSIPFGKEGYHLLMATANLGNGEFQGTFETDRAMYNRLHLAIDFDYGLFEPTEEDKEALNRRKADPSIKFGETKDLSDKIIQASREIARNSSDLGVQANMVIDYLAFGLKNCMRNASEGRGTSKGKIWPLNCQDCTHNPRADALCSLVREPVTRTLEATKRYAAALDYLAKLKDPTIEIDPSELVFKAFELAGAYQFLLNPLVLKNQHISQNPVMMAEVVGRLREDFEKNRDFIEASYRGADEGKNIISFFEHKGQFGNFDDLDDKAKRELAKKRTQPLSPFTDSREIGLGYVERRAERKLKEKEGI